MAEVKLSENPVFVGHGLLQDDGSLQIRAHKLQCNNFVVGKEVYLKDAVAFTYDASLGRYSEMFVMDEEDTSSGVGGESKQDSINSSNDSDHGLPVLDSSQMVIEDDYTSS